MGKQLAPPNTLRWPAIACPPACWRAKALCSGTRGPHPLLFQTDARWGLDFVWPYLMHYPRDKIGVIDEVCVFHPPTSRAKGNTLYHVGELPAGHHGILDGAAQARVCVRGGDRVAPVAFGIGPGQLPARPPSPPPSLLSWGSGAVAPYSAKQEEQVRFNEWGFSTAKRMKLVRGEGRGCGAGSDSEAGAAPGCCSNHGGMACRSGGDSCHGTRPRGLSHRSPTTARRAGRTGSATSFRRCPGRPTPRAAGAWGPWSSRCDGWGRGRSRLAARRWEFEPRPCKRAQSPRSR